MALGETQDHATAERVARGDHRLVVATGGVADRGVGEFVQLGEDRIAAQPARGPEAGQVEGDRPLAATSQQS